MVDKICRLLNNMSRIYTSIWNTNVIHTTGIYPIKETKLPKYLSSFFLFLSNTTCSCERGYPRLIRPHGFIVIVPMPAPKRMSRVHNLQLTMTKTCFTKNRPLW
ncbi:hypothetical protein Hanom_Chr11g00991071 [Helianthus anomalus]